MLVWKKRASELMKLNRILDMSYIYVSYIKPKRCSYLDRKFLNICSDVFSTLIMIFIPFS